MAKKKVKASSRSKAKSVKKRAVVAKSKKAAKAKAAKKPASPKQSKALAPGYRWVNPYLVVRDIQRAIDFYRNAFGFSVRVSMPGPDGKLMHAELSHNDSVIMLGPENPQRGSVAPTGPSPVTIYTYVENVDDVASRALANGGKVVDPPSDQFWGDRCCVLLDPDGHFWMLATHVRDIAPEDMHP